ncbi:hypothetical protein GJ496_007035 [Pomphorhynchus laevis]|nr:hypothetical protein GJ496_007035 [Pomphorhynchus laevis]
MWERKELDKLMSESKILQSIYKNRKFKSQNVNSSGWYPNYIRLIANGCFPHAMRLLYNNGAEKVIHKVDDEICPRPSVRDELIRLHPESKGIEPSSVISQKVLSASRALHGNCEHHLTSMVGSFALRSDLHELFRDEITKYAEESIMHAMIVIADDIGRLISGSHEFSSLFPAKIKREIHPDRIDKEFRISNQKHECIKKLKQLCQEIEISIKKLLRFLRCPVSEKI